MSTRADNGLFDPAVAALFARAAAEIHVDVDAEWIRLVDRVNREGREVAAITPPPHRETGRRRVGRGAGLRLLLVAAALLLLLMFTGPVFVRTTVNIVNFVQEVVEPPVTTTTTTTTTLVPPPVTPPPTVTTGSTDLAHAPILDGDQYRLTLRQVHDQLNAAIGYGRQDYNALQGADVLVESLLGQRPQYDADLRDVIGHLRQAMRAHDRRAASAAHTIIDRVQRETAGG